jgi:hypothetical protein
VEAFWSSKASISAEIKYVFGTVWWALVASYFWMAGRVRGA